jgi:aerotaxis receptor
MRDTGPVTGIEYVLPPGQTIVSVTDTKGRIVYANKAFVTASGFSEAELLGQPHNLVRHPDVPAEAFRDLWATIERGKPWTAVVKNRRKDGGHYWVRAHATPMRRDDRIVGYLSVRTVPARDEIAAFEALFARMQAEARAGRLRTVLHEGQVCRSGLVGRVQRRWRDARAWFGTAGLVTAGALAATAGAATILPLPATAVLALTLALLTRTAQQRFDLNPVRRLVDAANVLASGDLTHAMPSRLPGPSSDLAQALEQLSVTLRTLIGDSRHEVGSLRSVADEVAAGAREMSARTEAQAASLAQTMASMARIRDTARHTATSSDEGSQRAQGAQAAAQGSADAVGRMVTTMDAISGSSNRIADIIAVIEGVAFQTNILALNAAVEAARAGDHGRGFAVVASEVRALAHRTTDAARDVRRLIAESSSAVADGARVTADAQQRMQGLAGAMRDLQGVLEQVRRAAATQQGGVTQVADSVGDLDGITQRNAAMVEELSAVALAVQEPIRNFDAQLSIFQLEPGQPSVAERDAVALRKAARQAGGAAAVDGAFDLQAFTAAHLQWKTRLRDALRSGEHFDIDTVRRDDCCKLGQWLHGVGRRRWRTLPAFDELLRGHAQFHREAAAVAQAANQRDAESVDRLLSPGSAFVQATQGCVMAMRGLDADLRSPQAEAQRP